RTQTRRKTLNPVWDEEFRYELADTSILQNEPIAFKVMDKDVYTADDVIGMVYIDLSPLLMRASGGRASSKDMTIQAPTAPNAAPNVSGWFPLYDTLRGVRGEIYLEVKVKLIGDQNPFRESSAGVHFFGVSRLDPSIYRVLDVYGMVEELIVDKDPEFQWKDNFRQARSSNQSRQGLMYKLDAQVRRQLGRKVQEAGGNAVLAYQQDFDIEGDSGLVARAYGTACLIEMVTDDGARSPDATDLGQARAERDHDGGATSSWPLGAVGPITPMSRPTTNAYFSSQAREREARGEYMEDVRIITLKEFDPHAKLRLGGLVMARSVKYLGKLASTISDQDTRDGWWIELREEIRNHAKILCCSHVIGYTETATIHDDVCILAATGTAAQVRNLRTPAPAATNHSRGAQEASEAVDVGEPGGGYPIEALAGNNSSGTSGTAEAHAETSSSLPDIENGLPPQPPSRAGSNSQMLSKTQVEPLIIPELEEAVAAESSMTPSNVRPAREDSKRKKPREKRAYRPVRPCSYCHVPYRHKTAPFQNMRLVPCGICGRKWVAEFVMSTTEPPEGLLLRGEGVLVVAQVCRVVRRSASGENDAVPVSEGLPFLEYELQRQLMLKLRVLGMNALFSMQRQVQVGPSLLIGTATATAVYVEALPAPLPLVFKPTQAMKHSDRSLGAAQRKLEQLAAVNRQRLATLAPQGSSGQGKRCKSRKRRGGDGKIQRLRRRHSFSAEIVAQVGDDDSQLMQSIMEETNQDVDGGGNDGLLMPQFAKHRRASTGNGAPSRRGKPPDSLSSTDSGGSDTSSSNEGSSMSSSSTSSSSDGDDDSLAFSENTSSGSETRPRKGLSRKASAENEAEMVQSDGWQGSSSTRRRKRRYKDTKSAFVMEIDDETDEDTMAVLMERHQPPGVLLVSGQHPPGGSSELVSAQLLISMQRAKLGNGQEASSGKLSATLGTLHNDALATLCFKVRDLVPCALCGLESRIKLTADSLIELVMTATVILLPIDHILHQATAVQQAALLADEGATPPLPPTTLTSPSRAAAGGETTAKLEGALARLRRRSSTDSLVIRDVSEYMLTMMAELAQKDKVGPLSDASVDSCHCEDLDISGRGIYLPLRDSSGHTGHSSSHKSMSGSTHLRSGGRLPIPGTPVYSNNKLLSSPLSSRWGSIRLSSGHPSTPNSHQVAGSTRAPSRRPYLQEDRAVEMTSLTHIPGAKVVKYFGGVSLHFIKEGWSAPSRLEGGTFFQRFIIEVNSVMRAHVASLGGNALLCYSMRTQESGGKVR
ncbi:unnamed protein product, partial [Chrysoparadoxa australica]